MEFADIVVATKDEYTHRVYRYTTIIYEISHFNF